MPRSQPNRAVYVGSEALLRRLRGAKRPDIIVPLEIPPEEMDIEPATIEEGPIHTLRQVDDLNELTVLPFDVLPTAEPINLPGATPQAARLAAHEIAPDDEDD